MPTMTALGEPQGTLRPSWLFLQIIRIGFAAAGGGAVATVGDDAGAAPGGGFAAVSALGEQAARAIAHAEAKGARLRTGGVMAERRS